jgi:hypothetical protein
MHVSCRSVSRRPDVNHRDPTTGTSKNKRCTQSSDTATHDYNVIGLVSLLGRRHGAMARIVADSGLDPLSLCNICGEGG